MPVRTASDIVHIEGKSAVLIEHKVNNKLVQTCLYPVYYIPKISTCLISMGQFLNDGLSVKGDAHHISLYDKMQPMLTCKPISFSQNVYWLDTSVTDIQAKASIFNTIYLTDYNLLHRCLGHLMQSLRRRGSLRTSKYLLTRQFALAVLRERCLHLPILLLLPE
jgi:hypothetical protein